METVTAQAWSPKFRNNANNYKSIDDTRLYCRLCLEKEQERYKKNDSGHVSKVKNYGNSSTCTLRKYFRTKHYVNLNAIDDDNDNTANDG